MKGGYYGIGVIPPPDWSDIPAWARDIALAMFMSGAVKRLSEGKLCAVTRHCVRVNGQTRWGRAKSLRRAIMAADGVEPSTVESHIVTDSRDRESAESRRRRKASAESERREPGIGEARAALLGLMWVPYRRAFGCALGPRKVPPPDDNGDTMLWACLLQAHEARERGDVVDEERLAANAAWLKKQDGVIQRLKSKGVTLDISPDGRLDTFGAMTEEQVKWVDAHRDYLAMGVLRQKYPAVDRACHILGPVALVSFRVSR